MSQFPLYGALSPLGARWRGATPWYRAGGVAAANCLVAYQPKGAASQAASYTNIANPGTYNATVGVAPTWDATNGWIFNGTSQYLTVPYTLAHPVSLIVRFSGRSTDGFLTGAFISTSSTLAVAPRRTSTTFVASYGTLATLTNSTTSGVAANTVTEFYINGSSASRGTGTTGIPALSLFIGCVNLSGSPSLYANGNVQAYALYNTTLSAAQVAAITTAMQAL